LTLPGASGLGKKGKNPSTGQIYLAIYSDFCHEKLGKLQRSSQIAQKTRRGVMTHAGFLQFDFIQ